ncbi:hypothetical protein K525DRAFT_200984 [Schizophyllum commune Loenen D]|nr:hypothetical protein K525DRAFT_200984 [Schizophyllum commune Loenen D]
MASPNPFPPGSGDTTIICRLPSGEPYLLSVSKRDIQATGSVLYSYIRQAQQTSHRAANPVVELDIDADEMVIFLEAMFSGATNYAALGPSRLAVFRSAVVARLSPKYGTPALTAKAVRHLCEVFCFDRDSIYQLSFSRDDFTIAVAALQAALVSEETRSFLAPCILAFCAQFAPALMHHPTSFKAIKPPPTQRSFSLPDELRVVCIEAHDPLRAACLYRVSHIFKYPAVKCTTRSSCRNIIESAREDTEDDPTLIGATTRPSPKLAKGLQALCSECLHVINWHDDCSLFVIWSNRVFPALGDSRSWKEIRHCALEYLATLPPVEPESRDDSSDSSSESESESRGRASGSRKKAKVLTSQDDRGFIDILSRALNWLE